MARSHAICILILFINIVYFCYAGDINCANFQDANCFRKTINCVSDGKNCTVNCNANQACKNSIINCAPSVGCFIHCTKYQSCQNIIINGGSAITLSIQTTKPATQVLTSGQINCQNVSYCDITCTENRYQCRDTKIKAENAGQLIIRCDGNQYSYHCQGMDIYCPKIQSKCWIFSTIALTQIDIYSQSGFDGVSLCGNTGYNSIGNMHCGAKYETTCPIHAFSVNYCDAPSICDATNMFATQQCNPPAPTTFHPTLSPTKLTTIPTTIPTLIPSFIPTNQPTIYPTNYDNIKVVTKTVMVFARNSKPGVFTFAGFAVILILFFLMCCVTICIITIACIKIHHKSNITHVNNNNANVNELQQLTPIPANNGLILYRTSGSNEGNNSNEQYIERMNDDDDENNNCNTKYEGFNTNKTKAETCKQT
eukprot:194790_1